MKKLHLPLLLASLLLLTGCTINTIPHQENIEEDVVEPEVIPNEEITEEEPTEEEEILEENEEIVEEIEENEPVSEEELIEEEEPVEEELVEEPVSEEELIEEEEPVEEENIHEEELVEEPAPEEEVVEEEPVVEEPVVEEPVQEEEPVVEEPVVEEPVTYNENVPLRSPVYRPAGTTNVDTLYLNVRSYEATITDSGRVHQKMDIVYLDYNYGGLQELGYNWLDVRVTLTAREVHDGYQYLFLYNTTVCQSSGESLLENFIPSVGDSIKQGMLFKEQFEIGPGYKKTSWEERSFHFYVYVGNMVDNLYLRYGANGILSDTWVNKDIRVSVTPKMTKN